jgi:hypothetical protein
MQGDEIRALRRLRRGPSAHVFLSERGGPMTPKSFHGLFARIGERAQRAAEAEADRRADSRRDVNIDAARVRIRMAPDGTPD